MPRARWIGAPGTAVLLGVLQSFTVVCFVSSGGPAQAAEVVALGASNTFGYGLYLHEDYPYQLEGLLRAKGFAVSVKNAGISGNTSQQVLDRLEGVLDADTKVVILEIFRGNDRNHSVPREDTLAHIREMLAKLKSHHVNAILVRSIETEYADVVVGDLPRQIGDHKHFTAEGQRIVAERVLPLVIKYLRQ